MNMVLPGPRGRESVEWRAGSARFGRGGALLMALLFSAGVQASASINAAELVREVLQRHAGQQALSAAVDAAESRIMPAGALPDPMLSWSVAPNTIGDARFGTRQTWQFSQALPWPGKLGLAREAAAAAHQMQAHDLASLQLQIAEHTRQYFGQWYWVDQALAINAANQALLGELSAVATQRYASGQGTQQAVLQAELRQASLQRENLQLEQRKHSLQAAINALRDRPFDAPLAAPQPWSGPPPLPPLDVLVASAQRHQPALKALDAREQQSRQQLALAQRDSLPDLRLNLAHVGTMDPAEKRLQAGISLNLPLNFARRRHQVDAAEAQIQQARWAQRDVAAQLAAAVAQAYSQVQQSRQTIALYQSDLLPLAEQNLSAARADWRSGAGDFQAVIDAEQQLLATRLGIQRARVDEWSARATLARQVADPDLNLFEETQP